MEGSAIYHNPEQFSLPEDHRLLKAINEALFQLLSQGDTETALRSACETVGNAIKCEGVVFFKFGAITEAKAPLQSVFCLAKTDNKWERWTDFTLELPLEDDRTRTNFHRVRNEDYISITSRAQNGPNLTQILEQLGVGSYFSCRIVIDGVLWGVGSFASRALSLDWVEGNVKILMPFLQSVGNFLARKQNEARITEQRDLLHQIIDTSPNPIYVKKLDGTITLANKSMAAVNRLAHPDLIIGKNIREFAFKADNIHQMEAEELPLLQGEKDHLDIIKSVNSYNNQIRYIRASKSLLNDKTGNKLGIVTMLHDLTDIKKIEQQLISEKQFSENITNIMPDWVIVVDFNNRCFRYHNLTYPILGFTKEEITNPFELLINNLHPDDQGIPEDFITQLNELKPNEIAEKQFRLQHKDGQWLSFYERARVMSRDEAGHVKEYLAVIQDITFIKETQLALQHSENILKATINALPDLKFRITKDGTYLNFYQSDNESIRPYAPASTIIGNRVQDVFPGEVGSIFLSKIKEAIQARTVKVHEYEIEIPGTGLEYREARISPINEEEVIVVVRNISERKRAEKALKESQERYFNFIKHSHDGIYYMNCGSPIYIHSSFDEITNLYYENAYIEECNEAMARMYNTTVENLKGTAAITLHGGEHFDENKKSFKDLIKNNFRVADAETIEPDVHGNLKYFLNNAVGIIENEHLIGFWGTQIDITERKQAQQREQSRTYVLELLSKGAALHTILEEIVRGVEQHKKDIICSILLLDVEKKRLWTACAPSLPDFYNEAINGSEIGMGVGSCGTAAYTGERVVVADIQAHPYWENYKALATRANLRACWSEPIKDSSGNVLGSFAIYHQFISTPTQKDIELIKQAADLVSVVLHKFKTDEILKANEERWKFAIAGSNDGTWDWNINTNQVYFSSRWKEMLGFEDHEIQDTVEEWSKRVHPDDIEWINHKLRETFSGEEPIYIIEHRLLCKDGTYKWIMARGKVLAWNADGTPARMVGTHTDISERKQAEKDLLENRSLLKAIIDTLPDLKFRVNKSGLFLDYYESEHENEVPIIPPAEFIGKNIMEVLPSFIAEIGLQSIQQAIEQRQINTFEYMIPIGDDITYYEGRVSPFGEAEAIVAVRNISDRKKAQLNLQEKLQELDEKNKQLTQYIESNFQLENFAYIASHDLREPVRTVHSFAQLLKKRYTPLLDEDGQKCLDFIVYGSENMNRLIDDLLSYSRVSSEEHFVETIVVDALLSDVINGLTRLISEKNAFIVLNDLPLHIMANPSTIKQLFQNLITNGVKFQHPDRPPVIEVSGIDYGDYWLFEIKDNGIGIPEDMREKIFQLFKKIHYVKEHHGTGIGLAICKRIAEQHGGEIWVESSPEDGSSFYFTIKKQPTRAPEPFKAMN